MLLEARGRRQVVQAPIEPVRLGCFLHAGGQQGEGASGDTDVPCHE